MTHTYTVEVLNLGKRPVPDVSSRTTRFGDQELALAALHRTVGELVLHPGLVVVGAERREDVGDDGIVAAVRLAAEAAGGRIEVLLRRQLSEDPDDDA